MKLLDYWRDQNLTVGYWLLFFNKNNISAFQKCNRFRCFDYFMTQGGLDKNFIFSISKPSKILFLSETLSYTLLRFCSVYFKYTASTCKLHFGLGSRRCLEAWWFLWRPHPTGTRQYSCYFGLRIPDSYDAKKAKICNPWTLWPVIQLINHLFEIRQKAFLPNAP